MPESRDHSAAPVGVARRVPGLGLARHYRRAWLRGDVIAGIVLVTLLVPQGMAYAELAGLPPVTGLYTTVLALTAYAVFGPSRILVLGPDSALGPLIAAAILPLLGANGDPTKAVALAGMLALLIGVFCVVAGLARLGILAELLSKPVRTGFLNGIAVVVLVGQLPQPVRVRHERAGSDRRDPGVLRGCARREHGARGAVGRCCVARSDRHLAPRRRPRCRGSWLRWSAQPWSTGALDLASHGVVVVGPMPSGFPSPTLPDVAWHDVGSLVVAAAGMAFVILADTATLGRTSPLRRGEPSTPTRRSSPWAPRTLRPGSARAFRSAPRRHAQPWPSPADHRPNSRA